MNQDITVTQLDRRFQQIPTESLSIPQKGWIRAIREALGMTTGQLASRVKVDQSVVVRYEEREEKGTITVDTLRQVADALDCDLVYTFKPRRSLTQMIRERAMQKARDLVGRVSHSMNLEEQGLSKRANEEQVEQLTEELLRGKRKKLWED